MISSSGWYRIPTPRLPPSGHQHFIDYIPFFLLNVEQFIFPGSQSIHPQCFRPSQFVTLHITCIFFCHYTDWQIAPDLYWKCVLIVSYNSQYRISAHPIYCQKGDYEIISHMYHFWEWQELDHHLFKFHCVPITRHKFSECCSTTTKKIYSTVKQYEAKVIARLINFFNFEIQLETELILTWISVFWCKLKVASWL